MHDAMNALGNGEKKAELVGVRSAAAGGEWNRVDVFYCCRLNDACWCALHNGGSIPVALFCFILELKMQNNNRIELIG